MTKKYIALDLELLCNKNGIERHKGGELIENHAFCVKDTCTNLDNSSFVQPINKRKVNLYTRNLLGITESDFDGAPSFEQVANSFEEWAEKHDVEMWMSWGDVDYTKIREAYQMARIKLPTALSKVYYDAQIGYQRKSFSYNRVGLNRALENEGVFHNLGTHRALDDAKKIPMIINQCL